MYYISATVAYAYSLICKVLQYAVLEYSSTSATVSIVDENRWYWALS